VIVPLDDHRGLALRSIEAWVRQSLSGECYEIVAPSGGRRRRLLRGVERRLRPQDRVLVVPGGAEIELYQAGADAARGELLLFTESHCVPDKGTAEAVVRFFTEERASAGTLRSAHISNGGLSGLEARLTREESMGRTRAGAWSWVSLRGFAIRAPVFRGLGGFRTELERFAETALGIELVRRGVAIPTIPDAVVSHADCVSVRELETAALSLGRGRRAFREAGPLEHVLPYLGRSEIEPAALHPRTARAFCRVLVRALLSARGRGMIQALARGLVASAPAAVAGTRGTLVAERLSARLALWRCLLSASDVESRFPGFAAAFHGLVRSGELERLRGAPLPPLPRPARGSPVFSPGEMDDAHFLGFHAREVDHDGPFRWSRPAGLVRLPVEPGRYLVTVSGFSPPGQRHLRLYFNGRPAPFREEPGEAGRLSFQVDRPRFRPGGEQHLGLVAAPYVPRDAGLDDPRPLGLAMRAIRFDALT
jgi:hypothetical protein